MLRAFDHLPRNFIQVLSNTSTALTLPLVDVWFLSKQSPLMKKHPGYKKLATSEFFYINDQCLITRKDYRDPPHPRLKKAFFDAIDNGMIFMELFFARVAWLEPTIPPHIPETIDCSPFVWTLGTSADDNSPLPATKSELSLKKDPKERRIQYYKRYYDDHPHPSDNIHSKYWKDFWNFDLHHTARNVWFRLIHNKIPNIALMNSWMPHSFVNPY
ncbi:unnamed protein product [Rhizopus stolonifer]